MPLSTQYRDHDREPDRSTHLSRRTWLAGMGASLTLPAVGCVSTSLGSVNSRPPDLIIGQRGLAEGRFQKPRAIAIDAHDIIYVCDKTARIQAFDDKGTFIRGWQTPAHESGKPTGISIDPSDGNVLVADTHYFRFLFYTPKGELLESKTIGGVNGAAPGEFAFVTDIARAPSGQLFLGEYGQFDRIMKYTRDGRFLNRFGEHGEGPLQFSRPQCLSVDAEGWLWIADSCNHRIQVVDWTNEQPKLISTFGTEGNELGQFKYPYGLALVGNDKMVVSEFGNHRVQLLKRDGTPIATWGSPGERPGELNQPWASAVDSRNRVYVVDSGNNRVQRFTF